LVQQVTDAGLVTETPVGEPGSVTTDRLVNGAHELELIVNGATPYVIFPAADGGNVIIQGNQIGAEGSGAASLATLSSAESDVRLSANATGAGAARKDWTFGTDGNLTLPEGGDILDSNGDSVLGGGSYTPDDSDNWNDPTINTISAALDELAARVTALQNYEIDGGNANTPELGELLIDGNGA